MELKAPFIISSRLCAGLKVGSAIISMEVSGVSKDGRLIYHYWIDHQDFEYENNDLKSGVGNRSLQKGFKSLLSFLNADAEKYRYVMLKPDTYEPEYCFDSVSVIEWAYQNSDDIIMLLCELEESQNLITD